MDIYMPKLTGDRATQAIKSQFQLQSKSQPQASAPIVIAITASAFEEDRTNILAAGCDGFIRKPFQQAEIIESLTRHLQVQLCHLDMASPPPKSSSADPDLFSDREGRSLKILLAESDAAQREAILAHLKQLGYEADVAEDGLEVLYAIALQEYDAILMDVQMADMDGLKTTRTIRQQYPENKQPYIIAMVADDAACDRATCIEAGTNDCIRKPILLEPLRQALQSLVESL